MLKSYFPGLIFLLIFLLGVFGLVGNSKAANIYVDRTLAADCTSGNYSTADEVRTVLLAGKSHFLHST